MLNDEPSHLADHREERLANFCSRRLARGDGPVFGVDSEFDLNLIIAVGPKIKNSWVCTLALDAPLVCLVSISMTMAYMNKVLVRPLCIREVLISHLSTGSMPFGR